MLRHLLLLSSLVSLLSFCFSHEAIVQDSAGHGVNLPTTGGNNTAEITTFTATRSTSPYTLQVILNNGQTVDNPNNPIVGAIESFYFNTVGPLFGSATLISQVYSPSFLNGTGGLPGDYLGNASHPNTATGVYTFTFTIPVLQYFRATLTYMNTALDPLPVVDTITIVIFNPSIVVGDPQFIGLRGQPYQVHGVDGQVYNIISEKNTQVNSRFVFLTEGECPIINGMSDTNCWSHPGSYMGEMSFQQLVNGKLHAAQVTAGDSKEGFSQVQVDGKELKVGEKLSFGSFTISMISTHSVNIQTEHFDFHLSNSDMFINQALRAKVALSKLQSHGLLGQTHSAKIYATPLKYIEGDVDDYVIADHDIFGNEFVYNKFHL